MPPLKRVGVYDSLQALPSACRALLAQGSAHSFFLSAAWFDNLVRHGLGDRSAARVYAMESPSGAELILPMRALEPASRFASRKLDSLANYYTSLFGPLFAEPPAPQDWHAIAAALAADTPRWDVVDLHPLDPESAGFAALQMALRANGFAVQPYFCFGNWVLDVQGRSFDAYRNALPSKLRNTLQRRAARLEKLPGFRMQIIESGPGVEQGIAAFEQVYASSWKTPEPHPHFMPGLIRLCAQQGWLRLGVATIDGVPAAAQLWIVQGGVAHIYKLAYDERFAGLSVGTVLTAHLMRHALDVDRVQQVDYLTGDEPYKRDWMSRRRERWGLMAFNLRTIKGLALAARHLGAERLRRMVRT